MSSPVTFPTWKRVLRASLPLVAPLALAVLAGCAGGAGQPADAVPQATFAPGMKLGHLSIGLSAEAQQATVYNSKFSQATLIATVRRAFAGSNLLTDGADASLPNVEIVITDVRVRSNFRSIAFDLTGNDDHITGEVIVRASSGVPVRQFTVSASYAGGLPGTSQDRARMDWLYERFAARILAALTSSSG